MDELKLKLISIGRTLMKYGKYIENLEKDVAILKKDSHPPIRNLERRLRKIEKKRGE